MTAIALDMTGSLQDLARPVSAEDCPLLTDSRGLVTSSPYTVPD